MARQLVVAFYRLVDVGGRSHRDVLALPRRPIELFPEYVDEIPLHENDGRKGVAAVELELHVIAPREAIVAAVRAAAIWVERPVERHAFHRVQRGSTGNLLVLGAVRPMRGIRQSVNWAVLLYLIGDVTGGGLLRREIKEERIDLHGRTLSYYIRLFYFLSPIVKQI